MRGGAAGVTWNMTLASWHHALGTHRTTSRGGGCGPSVESATRERARGIEAGAVR